MKWWIRLVAAASMVAAVSGVVRICGLEDTVFFNKSAASLGVFFLGLILVPKAFGHWHEDRRSFLEGFGLAFALEPWFYVILNPGRIFFGAWGIIFLSCFVSYEMLPPFGEVHKVEAESKLPWLKAYYCWFTDENLQRCLPGLCLFFYTSFNSWCVLFAAVMLAAKRRYKELILPLFPGSYLFTLVFGPCIIVRYVLGVMMFQMRG